MVERPSARRRLESLPPAIGALASLAGGVLLLVYPLTLADVLPGNRGVPPDFPTTSHPLVVYCSIVGGSVLLTWGAFAVRDRTYTPLTPHRTLLALLPSILGIAAGVGWFTYEWVGATPLNTEGNEVSAWDPSLLEIVKMELTAAQFVTLSLVSATFVGAVAAQRGRRDALASALLPAAFIVLAVIWQARVPYVEELLFVLVLLVIPFGVGYVATSPD